MKKIILMLFFSFTVMASTEMANYSDTSFAIAYPKGWKHAVDTYPTSTEVTFTGMGDSLSGFIVSVAPAKKDLKTIEQEELARITNAKGVQTLVSHGPSSLAQESAVKIVRTLNAQAIKGQQVDYFILKNGRLVHISYVIEANKSAAGYQKQFDTMLASIKFK